MRSNGGAAKEYLMTQDSVFYKNMKPALITMRLMGILPYHISSEGRMSFRYFSVAAVYSLVVIMMVAVGVTSRVLQSVREMQPTFVSRMYVYVGMIVYIPAVALIPLAHWPETCKKVTYVNNWSSFQYEFTRVTGKNLDLGLEYKVTLGLLANATYVCLQCVPFILNVPGAHMWWIIPTMLFCAFFHMLLAIPWVAFCSSLKIAGEHVTKEMEVHVATCGFGYGIKISQYRVLWLQLCRLTQDLGNSMGITFGAHVLNYFAGQVLFTYYILSMLGTDFQEFALKFMVPVAISCYIYLLCNAAQAASDEIGEKFLERLEILEAKFPPKNSDADSEVQKFYYTIERNPPVISFCGFANVNRGLQTSFMSALVTYMIVLLQFNMGSQDLEIQYCDLNETIIS